MRVRIAQPLLGKLDEWITRQEDKITRQDAVRRILANYLFESHSQRRIAARVDHDEDETG